MSFYFLSRRSEAKPKTSVAEWLHIISFNGNWNLDNEFKKRISGIDEIETI